MAQQKKEVLIIIGSASENSSNEKLIKNFIRLAKETMNCIIFNELSSVPHFDPKYTFDDSPAIVEKFRRLIVQCNGVVICTPEYIFSIPSRLKNVLEWCVSTTVFFDKMGVRDMLNYK